MVSRRKIIWEIYETENRYKELIFGWTMGVSRFGIAGVMASGNYLANEILKSEGIDLKKDFIEYFSSR